ncbi:site-specific integrase [Pontibacter sp. HSC-36F09]|uniref:site-specific integrase n=1 Tax=Pontibacter sp. HSC-36F09 TaxID=2910966 RepID=UPI0020A0D1A2|nr:site-specific integrase [Pontibacter sp. HSC-36F09]MCP2045058.1 integrase [Pontibacter sp. HSC-36F09]
MIQKTKADRSGQCPIYVEVSINPKGGKKDTKRIPTGEKIAVRYWSRKQEVMSSYEGYQGVNSAILKKKLEVQQHVRENPNATPADIKALCEKKPLARQPTVLELYEEFHKFKGHMLTLNGMKAIDGLKKLLTDYIETGHTLTLSDLSLNIYDTLLKFARSKYNSPNTAVKRLETLRTFFNYLTDRGINTNMDYRKWKLPRLVPTKMITLSYEELTKLYELQLENERLAKVRDLFIILCTTGLRFSDGSQLKPHDVHADSIQILAAKTKQVLTIPLNKFSRGILNKYDNDLSALAISNQKFNDYIKEVCCEAGIKGTVSVRDKEKKGKMVIKQKWEVISSHAGRRTFVTLSLMLGMRQDIVMALSGHSDYRSFRKYIDHTDSIKSAEMSKWDK